MDGLGKLNTTSPRCSRTTVSECCRPQRWSAGRDGGNSLSLTSGGKAYGGFELPSAADKVTVTIKDANGLKGAQARTGRCGRRRFNFSWDGLTTNGAQAASGNYTISVARPAVTPPQPTRTQISTVNSVLRTSSGSGVPRRGRRSGDLSDIKQIL